MYKIEFSMPAYTSLEQISKTTKHLQSHYEQLTNRLPYDPYPTNNTDKNNKFEAMQFKALVKQGFNVLRLKAANFFQYRVFYIVDERERLIYILEIVKRDNNTYNLDAQHVATIKDLHDKYYKTKTKTGKKR